MRTVLLNAHTTAAQTHILPQACLPTKDNWKISEEGLYYLANHKEERRLTVKERIIDYIFGFVSGLLSGLLLEWLVSTLNL